MLDDWGKKSSYISSLLCRIYTPIPNPSPLINRGKGIYDFRLTQRISLLEHIRLIARYQTLCLLTTLLLLSGCRGGGDSDLMPLKVGSEWKYSVSGTFAKFVEPMRINREIGVAGTQGVELVGPMGYSSVAWKKGVLYADRLAGTSYSPPLPLLAADGRQMDWDGTVAWPTDGTQKATARLTHETQKLKLDANEYSTTRSRLQIIIDGTKSVELTTWFAPGIGIVRQEQRTGSNLDIRIDYLSGP